MSTESGAEQTKPDVHAILTTAKERVAEILVATDRAAAEILEAADAEATRVVADAHKQATEAVNARMERISSLIEGVMAKAGSVDSEFEQLRELVHQSTESLAAELGIETPSETAEVEQAADAAEGDPEPAPLAAAETAVAAIDGDGGSDDRADAVKLLAIQMIATGHTAERASERLKAEFHVEDPAAVLAEIGAPVDEE